LYGEVIVPPAVDAELRTGQERGVDVPIISSIDWIRIRVPTGGRLLPAVVDLGPGEAEVIALGLELKGSLLVLDDHIARRIAKVNRLAVTGTLGILIRCKEKGFLSSIRPILEKLQKTSMWLSDEVLQSALEEAKEL
jgi:predicted nucleic acid-binding protein